MTTYILDTDHLSLYGRNHPTVIARLQASQVQLTKVDFSGSILNEELC